MKKITLLALFITLNMVINTQAQDSITIINTCDVNYEYLDSLLILKGTYENGDLVQKNITYEEAKKLVYLKNFRYMPLIKKELFFNEQTYELMICDSNERYACFYLEKNFFKKLEESLKCVQLIEKIIGENPKGIKESLYTGFQQCTHGKWHEMVYSCLHIKNGKAILLIDRLKLFKNLILNQTDKEELACLIEKAMEMPNGKDTIIGEIPIKYWYEDIKETFEHHIEIQTMYDELSKTNKIMLYSYIHNYGKNEDQTTSIIIKNPSLLRKMLQEPEW